MRYEKVNEVANEQGGAWTSILVWQNLVCVLNMIKWEILKFLFLASTMLVYSPNFIDWNE